MGVGGGTIATGGGAVGRHDGPHPAVPFENDAALVLRAKRDPAEFAPLYLRYVDPVYRYCYRRLGSAEAAADATSQTFAKAIAGLPGCAEASFRSWLFAIAHNVLVDSVRARRTDASLEAAATIFDPTPSPEEAALAGEQQAEVQRVLTQLSPDQRRVVELRLAGLRSNEIGAVLGRSRGAVDAIQARAVARLRHLLGATNGSAEGRHATT